MRTILLLLIMFLGLAALANDGVYWSSGSVLHPMKETHIALQGEHLSFSVRGEWAQVDVLFEFMNPESVTRALTVGFQAPSAGGDQSEEVCSTPQIEDLRVMNDGTLLPFRLMMAADEDAPLVDLGQLRFTQEDPGVFVYVFEMSFKPGLNRVQHSYRFRASGSVDLSRSFDYILTTGAKWAGSTIARLSLEVDFGINERFFVKDIFGAKADWCIVGVGRIGTTRTSFYDEGERPVRIVSGKLLIVVDDLTPRSNIEFHAQREATFLDWPNENTPYDEKVFYALQGRSLDLGNEYVLNKADLRFLRNVLFAQQGYVFRDAELQKTFGQFDWYIPDPNLEWDDRMFSPQDRLFLELIKLKEAE